MTRALTTLLPGSPICAITSSSSTSSKPNNRICNLPCLGNNDVHTTSLVDASIPTSHVSRRNAVGLGIVGVVLGLNVGEKNAWAAARRPPPSPSAGEKKDPNVSGVLAKVLASKKRKEAMKEAMAKQRERGNKVEE